MGMRLAGKVAIITGATLGLGKAGALRFAEEGANVVICDRGRTPANSRKVLAEAASLSGEIAYKTCDVMQIKDIVALVRFTLERYGRIDVMVNNAVIDNPGGWLEDVTLKDWEEGISCHLTAPLLFCKEVMPTMVTQKSGSIINISSSNALTGSSNISSYGPAKAGMINFTKSLAVAYGRYGIRANTITPARMLTEKKLEMLRGRPAEARRQKYVYPLQGRPALPEQVAEVMLFLASDESSAVTGHNLIADRGNAALNPGDISGPMEEEIRIILNEQGSDWIQGE